MKKVSFQTIATAVEKAGILDPVDIHNALATSRTVGKPLITILLDVAQRYPEAGRADKLRSVLAEVLDIPFITDSNLVHVNMDLTRSCGLDEIEKTLIFFTNYGGEKYLHMPDPLSSEKADVAIAVAKQNDCDYCLLSDTVINTLMTRDIAPILISDRAKNMEGSTDEDAKDNGTDEQEAKKTDVAKMFHDIVVAGINSRASDIHLCPGKKDAMIRFRVDGILRDYMSIPLSVLEKLFNYVVSQAKIAEPEKPKEPRDGAMEFQYTSTKIIPLRISAFEETGGHQDICIRILNSEEMNLNDLGMKKDHQDIVNRLFKMTKGIVLFVGPTGSGKSTSLYAGIRATDYLHRCVITCEDPVEQKMPGITQVEINEEAGMTYEKAIVANLRHDPDILVVGEIREYKVGIEAIKASETGHLVISTLHCNNAPAAVSRLTGIEIPEQDVASSLSAVIAQRLVRRVCPHCKKTYKLAKDHPWRDRYDLGEGEIELAKGAGCAECEGTGYRGRIVLTEIMVCNRKIRAAIERKAPFVEIENLAAEAGYHPLIEDGIDKARDGITTFDEIDVLYNDII